MGLGDILPGQGTLLAVGDTNALGTEVGGLRGWSAPQQRNKSVRKYYGNTPTKTITGPSEDTWSLTCDLTSNDDGQRYVIAKYRASTEFFIGYADEAGAGEYQKVRGSQVQPQGQNPDEPNTTTYEFGGTEDRVDIGAGPG